MSAEPQEPLPVVKPHLPSHSLFPVVAVTKREILLERTGEVYPIEELPMVIVAENSSMIVAEDMGRYILQLTERFKDSKTFQYKLAPIYRDVHPRNGQVKRRAVLRDTTTSLVGFPGHYHHPVDPLSFIRLSLEQIDPRNLPRLYKLLEWGCEVRNYCLENDMKLKASAGGIASQLLRDRRFYPRARRKVPKMINTKGRDKLPGNFYQLYGKRETDYAASYIDMENSHHQIAQRVTFPCANELRAYGYFRSDKPMVWAKPNSPRLHGALKQHGLFHVRLSVPHLPPETFVPPYMQHGHGLHNVWIFSNEIPLLQSLGGKIEAIYAALMSPTADEGLSRYAKYAIAQLDARPDMKPWLKPLLHSAYGVLAARARPMEIGWRNCDGGESDLYPMAGKMVPVKVVKMRREIEAKIVNTIHRGMIEAEQRVMALTLARELQERGGKVLCIYADSLFVDMPQLPLLPSPWRLKLQTDELRFISATQFVSPQLTRLPGVPTHLQENYAPALRTRALDARGLPTRADSGTRTFRPMVPVD